MLKHLYGFGSTGSGFIATGKILAASGSYVLTGKPAGVQKATLAKSLAAAAGSYSLAGTAANLAKTSSMGAEAAAFLARTSGLDATHQNAYAALIDGLVADGVWSKLDVLYIYATQNSTTAALNLVSSTYNATVVGSPTFTTDRGFTGTESSSGIYINSNFNPATATTPKSVLNSAHLSVWTNAAVTGNGHGIVTGSHVSFIAPCHNAPGFFSRINSANAGGSVNPGAAAGHYIASRTASNAIAGYKNGSSLVTGSQASTAVPSYNYYSLGYNNSGAAVGSGQQHAMFSIGAGLNSTEAGNFYTRLRTYMTVVGVP